MRDNRISRTRFTVGFYVNDFYEDIFFPLSSRAYARIKLLFINIFIKALFTEEEKADKHKGKHNSITTK